MTTTRAAFTATLNAMLVSTMPQLTSLLWIANYIHLGQLLRVKTFETKRPWSFIKATVLDQAKMFASNRPFRPEMQPWKSCSGNILCIVKVLWWIVSAGSSPPGNLPEFIFYYKKTSYRFWEHIEDTWDAVVTQAVKQTRLEFLVRLWHFRFRLLYSC